MSTDPRDSTRETKLSLPKTWYAESVGEYRTFALFYGTQRTLADTMGSMGMFLAGLVLVSRNR
jgi:hypothetical protein